VDVHHPCSAGATASARVVPNPKTTAPITKPNTAIGANRFISLRSCAVYGLVAPMSSKSRLAVASDAILPNHRTPAGSNDTAPSPPQGCARGIPKLLGLS
jgi:hypothetical protein